MHAEVFAALFWRVFFKVLTDDLDHLLKNADSAKACNIITSEHPTQKYEVI